MERFPLVDELMSELFHIITDDLPFEEFNAKYNIKGATTIVNSRNVVWNRFAEKALKLLDPDSEPNSHFFVCKTSEEKDI